MTIYFDLDDTIYRLYDPFNKAYKDSFKYDIDIYLLWKQSRIHNNAIYQQYLDNKISKEQLAIIRLQKAFNDFNIEITEEEALLFQDKYEYYQNHLTLSKTMQDIFNYLKTNKINYGIITNGNKNNQMNKIKGLFKTIDFPIIISSEVNITKPDPKIFSLVSKDEIMIYVGDSYEIDMIGAKKANWYTFFYNHQHLKKDLSIIDEEIDNEEDLFKLIKRYAIK